MTNKKQRRREAKAEAQQQPKPKRRTAKKATKHKDEATDDD